MQRNAATVRPVGPHGFALWFTGAPYEAALAVTQFWHPAVETESDRPGKAVVASAANGEISWTKRDKVPRGLMHFAVCALRHLIRTEGEVPFGYLGPALRTLYNGFQAKSYRCYTIRNIFGKSGNEKFAEVPLGANMEQAFLIADGSERKPVVRLRERFQRRLGTGDRFPIYVFWEPSPVRAIAPSWVIWYDWVVAIFTAC